MSFWQDVKYGLRVLGREPGFTAVMVAALALGIGVNTTVFTLVNAVLFRGLPFEHSERVMYVGSNAWPRTATTSASPIPICATGAPSRNPSRPSPAIRRTGPPSRTIPARPNATRGPRSRRISSPSSASARCWAAISCPTKTAPPPRRLHHRLQHLGAPLRQPPRHSREDHSRQRSPHDHRRRDAQRDEVPGERRPLDSAAPVGNYEKRDAREIAALWAAGRRRNPGPGRAPS